MEQSPFFLFGPQTTLQIFIKIEEKLRQLLSVAAVPQAWGNAVIIPVLKKGLPGYVTNYIQFLSPV